MFRGTVPLRCARLTPGLVSPALADRMMSRARPTALPNTSLFLVQSQGKLSGGEPLTPEGLSICGTDPVAKDPTSPQIPSLHPKLYIAVDRRH